VAIVPNVDLRAVDGRVPGRRGQAKRQKLLERTAELLATTPYRDLRVMDIARAADASPATYYQYFPDVEAAILVLTEDLVRDSARLIDAVSEGSWTPRQCLNTALQVVDAFVRFWEDHSSLLRVVEVATAEGDARFVEVRRGILTEVINVLGAVVANQQARSGLDDRDCRAVAAAVVSMLVDVSEHRAMPACAVVDPDDLRRNVARLVAAAITGRRWPATDAR